jgi:hypothetical protein
MWDLVFSILKRKKKEKKGAAVNIYIFFKPAICKTSQGNATKVSQVIIL